MRSTVKDVSLNEKLSLSADPKPLSSLWQPHKNRPRKLVRRKMVQEFRRHWVLFLMVAPALAFFFVQSYLPMGGIYLAFTRFDFYGGVFGSDFVGLANFKYLFTSGTLLQLTFNTVAYNVVFIVVSTVLQVLCALALHGIRHTFFKRASQSILLFPYFVSFVIVGAFTGILLGYEHGFVSTLFQAWGWEPVSLYDQPEYWPVILVAAYVWKNLGYGVVIYLSAMAGQNEEYYEAARMDGASMVDQIRYVTIPLLRPTFIIVLLFSLATILRGQFDLFYQIIGNNGLLFEMTDILDTYVYRTLRTTFDVGMGTAVGLYQSIFGFIVILVVNQYIKKNHSEYSLF